MTLALGTRLRPCAVCRLAITPPAEMCAACETAWAPEWRCWLPFPPSVNNLFAHAPVKGRVRRFPTKRYKAWRLEAVTRLRANWRSKPPYPVPVVLKIVLVPPDRRARDASNHVKAIEDALVEARVLVDDNQNHVKAVIPYWQDPGPQSGAIVIIRLAKLIGEPQGALPLDLAATD